MRQTITLPFPPSQNGLFRRHNGARLSEAYRKWRDEAGWMIKAARVRPFSGPVSIHVDLVAPDKRRRDLDNAAFKAVQDVLKLNGIIIDDDQRYVRRLSAAWRDSGPACLVTIEGAA